MNINFIRDEGSESRNITNIIAEGWQADIETILKFRNCIDRETINNGAYIVTPKGNYINKTYGFMADSLTEVIEGLDLLQQTLLDEANSNYPYSFRHKLQIDKNDFYSKHKYYAHCRLTSIENFRYEIKK